MSSGRRVCAVTSPTPPAAASVTASPRASSLPRGCAPHHATPPSALCNCVIGEHEHDADDRELQREPGAEQPDRRASSALPFVRRPVSSKNDQNNASPTSAGTTNQPDRRSRRRYASRDATNAPAWLAVDEIVDAGEPRARPVRAREARADLAHEVLRERAIVGVARIGERGRRIEPMPGSTCTSRLPTPVSTSSTQASATSPPSARHRVDRPLIVRQRAVADAGQHDQPVVVAGHERRQRGRQPRMREQRRLDVGAVAEVEHVAGEHDRRPGRGTPRSPAPPTGRPRARCRSPGWRGADR